MNQSNSTFSELKERADKRRTHILKVEEAQYTPGVYIVTFSDGSQANTDAETVLLLEQENFFV